MTDIKEYLKYYIGCDAFISDEDGENKKIKLTVYNLNDYRDYLEDIKPILSRLEDMTEEDAMELDLYMNESFPEVSGYWKNLSEFMKMFLPPYPLRYRPGFKIYVKSIYWFTQHGYWLFGDEAFDQGLIIDKKTLK